MCTLSFLCLFLARTESFSPRVNSPTTHRKYRTLYKFLLLEEGERITSCERLVMVYDVVAPAIGNTSAVVRNLCFYLSEHPAIVNFRWSHTQSWGSTWLFLFTSIAAYLFISLFLHRFLALLRPTRTVLLGPIPALHSLLMSLVSVTIFAGILVSAAAEIRDTRWFWRRSKTPFQWLLCFPLGTRPSGRVFFWSYVYYLSRFLHMWRTTFTILRRRKLLLFQLFNNSISIVMSFLWLEFSQSFQVAAILATTLVYSVVYGYRFWTAMGLRSACFPLVLNCQAVLVGCNVACHVGVLFLHFFRGGCNGIGAWIFNSVLNVGALWVFLNFYVRLQQADSRKSGKVEGDFTPHACGHQRLARSVVAEMDRTIMS